MRKGISMKKILSLVLVLAMLASLAIYLPMGVSATSGEPASSEIYSVSVTDIANGTYTAAQLTEKLGAVSVTADSSATFVVNRGKLTITNPANATQDVVITLAELDAADESGALVVDYQMQFKQSDNKSTVFAAMQVVGEGGQNYLLPKVTVEGRVQLYTTGDYNNFENLVGQARTRYLPYNAPTRETWRFDDKTYASDAETVDYCIYGSTDDYRLLVDADKGMEFILNDYVAYPYTDTEFFAANSETLMDKLCFVVSPGAEVLLSGTISAVAEFPEAPKLIITEFGCQGPSVGQAEFLELYNNSDEEVNIYDYCLILESHNSTMFKVEEKTHPSNVQFIYPGSHTYTSINPIGADNPNHYTKTWENPAYEEGVLAPGEVAYLWCPTNSLHNSAYSSPTTPNNPLTGLDDPALRNDLGLEDETKMFIVYNDYNRSFNNSGSYIYAFADKDIYLDIDETAYREGNNAQGTVKEVEHDFANFESYAIWNSAEIDCRSMNGTGAIQQFKYIADNCGREGYKVNPDIGKDHTANIALPEQMRPISMLVNGQPAYGYLGYNDLSSMCGDGIFLYAVVNGTTIYADTTLYIDGSVTSIDLITAKLSTLDGVAIRATENAALRWEGALSKATYESLLTLQTAGTIKSFEIGTIVANYDDLMPGVAPSMDDVDAEKAQKVVATAGEWINESLNANDYVFGAAFEVSAENYNTVYVGIGYLTLTFADDSTTTVYGNYDEAVHARTASEVASSAYVDETNGLSDAQLAILLEIAKAYDAE